MSGQHRLSPRMVGRKLAALMVAETTCRDGWMCRGKRQWENCICPDVGRGQQGSPWGMGGKCGPTESFQEGDEVHWESPQDLHLFQHLTSRTPKQW